MLEIFSNFWRICLFFKIVIMIHIACISRGNNDWHDGIFGTIFCSSTSQISVNLDLSGISLPNSLLFNVLSIALCTKSSIVTTCYFPAEAYSWVFIVSWRISFQFLQKVSNNEIICLCRIKKVIIKNNIWAQGYHLNLFYDQRWNQNRLIENCLHSQA